MIKDHGKVQMLFAFLMPKCRAWISGQDGKEVDAGTQGWAPPTAPSSRMPWGVSCRCQWPSFRVVLCSCCWLHVICKEDVCGHFCPLTLSPICAFRHYVASSVYLKLTGSFKTWGSYLMQFRIGWLFNYVENPWYIHWHFSKKNHSVLSCPQNPEELWTLSLEKKKLNKCCKNPLTYNLKIIRYNYNHCLC